jgi:hypothetical protein
VPAHLEDQLLLPAGVLHRPLRRLLRTLRRDMRTLLLKGKVSATRIQRFLYRLDEDATATGQRFCRKTQKDPAKCLYSVMYTVYSVLLFPLWLKSVPGWPEISVSTFQQSLVGQIVWFGSLSAISQLASRGGGMGSWATLCLHSVTQPYTTCPRWREQGGGLRSLPLPSTRPKFGL